MLSPFSGRLRVPLKQKSVEAADASVQEVDFISGCVMLVSTRLIGRIGLFDPQYFYSVEDLDLCITAKKAGARILFFPDIVVHHKLAVTAAGWHSYFAVGHNVWGKARFLRKHFRGIHSLLPVLLHFTLFVPLKALQLELPLHRRVLRIADLLGFSVQGLTGKPHPRLMPENQGEKKGLQV
jgi:GT2 family glycosyltransferase